MSEREPGSTAQVNSREASTVSMPVEGVEKLCDFIRAFDKNN